ncbi:neprilysin-like isoform X3 [Rhodnius prolixus]|uniref:neprilysin-like isoform X3 n=1 Tax=Rhodnius prolixus TaxID=13249 RepID=UPI003D18A3C7
MKKLQGRKKICYSAECIKTAAMLLGSMDQKVDPCSDFFKFTCGKWSEAHVSQTDTDSWFSDRTRYLVSKMADVLSENITDEEPLPLSSAKSLYSSCMDTDRMDELGMEPLLSILESAGFPRKIPDEETAKAFNLAASLAKIQRALSIDMLVQLSIAIDPLTNRTVLSVGPGIGMPSLPELVTSEEQVSVTAKEVIALRLAYISAVLGAIDTSTDEAQLPSIALKILLTDSQIRADIQSTDSDISPAKITFDELQELMDSSGSNSTTSSNLRIDWTEYLSELMNGLNKTMNSSDIVYVENLAYFFSLAARLQKTRPHTLQRYLWWGMVSTMIPHTTNEMRTLKDDLYEALFRKQRQSRSYKCVKYVKTFFNLAISYKFASINSLKETSKKIEWMLKDITTSFNTLVDSLTWMDEKTKRNTWKKASSIKSYIGYPEWLLNQGELEALYKNIEVIDGQFLTSMMLIKSAEVREILSTLGDVASNKSQEWIADPLEVNAFYGRAANAVAIPAGILQSPFYFLGLEAMNYGAIGTILGHELTHAFDVEGKDYDFEGKRISWWDEDMTKEYNSRAQCFVDQYNNFGYTKADRLNGNLTLAENIADNGGVREAYHAYKYFLQRNGHEPYLPGMDHFTHEQLFFLSYANVWCEKTSFEDELMSLADVHSPNKFRVIGTLSNLDDFAEVWGCQRNTFMNPENKCVLW